MQANGEAKKERLYCLDLLRGIDMFMLCCLGMFVGTLQAATHWFPKAMMFQFHHEPTGFLLWDIIMPLFIFMCGAAVPFAMGRRLDAEGRPTPAFWKHLVTRFVMLWIVGMVVQGGLLTFDRMKLCYFSNTLQTIAIGYVAASLTLLVKDRRIRYSIVPLCFLAYGLILHFGGHGDYSRAGNLAMRLDKYLFAFVLPAGHGQLAPSSLYAWVLPSFMYVAMTLMGMHSTEILTNKSLSPWRRAGLLAGLAVAMMVVGAVTSVWVPLVKPIFTVSFTAWAIAWSMLALAILYIVTDIWKFRRGLGILILYGQVALASYLCHTVFHKAFSALSDSLTVGFERFMSHEWRLVLTVIVHIALLTFVLYVWRAYKRSRAR